MKLETESKGRASSALRRGRTTRQPDKSKNLAAFKSIVIPIDFSETSIKALDYALALAGEFGSQLHLVHALEFPAVFIPPSQPSYALWNKEAKQLATNRLAQLMEDKVDELITANCEVRFGRSHQAICDFAQEQKADLIVISTHGFTGLKHLLLGSTAERVIRHAPCSVLAVRTQFTRNAKAAVKPKNILVPTDFSQPAEQALQSAMAFARQFEAQLHLLSVVPVHYSSGDYDMMDYAMLAAEQNETAKNKLAELSRKLAAQNIAATSRVSHGRPAVEINQVAAELDCDLIVISTRGLTGWQHTLLGSTTEEVVRHSLCPVLVVRGK